MTPNWFADGQHILALGGGALLFATQCVNFWRANVTNQRVGVLHQLVQDNDAEILGELSSAQRALDNVITTISGRDRRKNPPGPIPVWANGGRGRRASDGAAS